MTRTRRITAAAVIVAAGVLGTAGVAYAGDYPGDNDHHSSHHKDHHSDHHCGCRDDHDGDWRDHDYRGDHHEGLLGALLGAL